MSPLPLSFSHTRSRGHVTVGDVANNDRQTMTIHNQCHHHQQPTPPAAIVQQPPTSTHPNNDDNMAMPRHMTPKVNDKPRPLPHHNHLKKKTTAQHEPTSAKTDQHHGSQTTASTHRWKEVMTRHSEQGHLPPPLISLIQIPGATLLTVTWQANDDQWMSVIVILYFSHHGKYSPLFIPTSHHSFILWQLHSYLVIVLTVFLLICVEYLFYGHCN